MWRVPIAAVLAWVMCALPAQAAFPGENGRLAFRDGSVQASGLYSVEPGGGALTPLGPGSAPAWSPDGTRIAFNGPGGQVWVMNGDGSGRTQLTTGFGGDPAWSPDGSTLVFARDESYTECLTLRNLFRMGAGGEAGGVTRLTDGDEDDRLARWSPDGRTIAFIREAWSDSSDPPLYCDVFPFAAELFVMNADGTDARQIGQSGIYDFDWSPDGSKLVYSLFSNELWTIRPDGSEETQLTATSSGPASSEARPVWSPDGTKIAFESGDHLYLMNADGTGVSTLFDTSNAFAGADWQPLPVDTPSSFVRPKAAPQIRVALVPAYQPCTAPNREHGPPLAFASCAPPAPQSTRLSVGIGDGNPALANSTGFMRLRVTVGDARIRLALTNVMRASDRSDYTGELRGEVTVRRTDREPGQVGSTTQDFPFGFTVPCIPTPASSADASRCVTTTSVSAVLPGAVSHGARTLWDVGGVRVYDGGPDEEADTASGNTLFMTQGVFVP